MAVKNRGHDQFCFVGDMLGFSALVTNLNDVERRDRVDEWVSLIDVLTEEEFSFDQVQLVSDTVFVGAPPGEEGLNKLVEFSRAFLETAFDNSLPFRGAIAFGEVEWTSRLAYGPAIVDAHTLSESQRWFGVCLSPTTARVGPKWDYDIGVCAYPVPIQGDRVMLRPAVSWNVPMGRELLAKVSHYGLMIEGDPLDWSVFEKVQNTLLFRLYREAAKTYFSSDPEHFHGNLPTDILEVQLLPGDSKAI